MGQMKPHKMETGQSIWALANIWDMLNEIKILSSASKLHPSLPQVPFLGSNFGKVKKS